MKKILFTLLFLIILTSCTQNNNQENKTYENKSRITIQNPNLILDNMQQNQTKQEILEIQTEQEIELEQKNDQFQLKTENKTILIWQPKPKTTWYWQLQGNLDLNYDVEVYNIDLFDTSKETINELHNKNIKIICYFSAGSSEDWRNDFTKFPKEVLGNNLDGWEGEKWLDISNYEKFSKIITTRLDLAVEKNCDGVEPDNIDGYLNQNGFNLNYVDQIKYNIWVAEEAHKRNLSIGLKNDLEQINDLEPYFDFAINEQCFKYNECKLLLPFIKNNKAVFHIEYELDKNKFCEITNNKYNFSSIKSNYDLNGVNMEFCN